MSGGIKVEKASKGENRRERRAANKPLTEAEMRRKEGETRRVKRGDLEGPSGMSIGRGVSRDQPLGRAAAVEPSVDPKRFPTDNRRKLRLE